MTLCDKENKIATVNACCFAQVDYYVAYAKLGDFSVGINISSLTLFFI